MTHIRTVIFDLGGVLIDWSPDYVFREIFENPEELRWFYDNVCTSEWNLQQDAGRSLAEATEEKVAEWPKFENEIRAYYGRWEDMLGGSIDEAVELLTEIRNANGHQLLALTNWSHETFPVALERFEFLQWFEGIVVSGQERTIKPLREIYEILINRYKVTRDQALFIDDNRDNVRGAREAGLHAVHFTDVPRLRQDLARYGVI